MKYTSGGNWCSMVPAPIRHKARRQVDVGCDIQKRLCGYLESWDQAAREETFSLCFVYPKKHSIILVIQ